MEMLFLSCVFLSKCCLRSLIKKPRQRQRSFVKSRQRLAWLSPWNASGSRLNWIKLFREASAHYISLLVVTLARKSRSPIE